MFFCQFCHLVRSLIVFTVDFNNLTYFLCSLIVHIVLQINIIRKFQFLLFIYTIVKGLQKFLKPQNTAFLILSGKYGVIYPNEEVSYYDHLLKSSEIENHSDLIASQIKSKKITSIEFFMSNIEKDRNLRAYVDCISKACAKASILLKIHIRDFQD